MVHQTSQQVDWIDPAKLKITPSTVSRLDNNSLQVYKNTSLEEIGESCGNLKPTTIHQQFERQVQRTPNAIAIEFEQDYLTYQELNHRANQLAHYLQELGVGSDSLVGICVERSLEMVIGLLGILKAGGAYIPLDPAFPRERLALMLEDAQPAILVTQAALVANLPPHQAQVVCLDKDWQPIAQCNGVDPNFAISPDQLAYVIYTSGSTGKPKGVQIQHRSVVNFLHSMRQQPGLNPQDILLAVTTLSFDIAVLELFLPLIVGARVVIARRDVAADGIQLANLMARSEATVMQATPATWRMLLKSGWQGTATLKILCGGEALPRELANQLLERSASVWNLYGPTETTIWSTVCRVDAGEESVPLGQPIANTQLYVLDAQLQPVPSGEIGELYIGGAGLARGYLNRAELTQERFISNPFPDFSNSDSAAHSFAHSSNYLSTNLSRLYRTGDLVRYRADGSLDCLGRVDHQVKIRGYRIELGEIEALLWQHPDVQEVVVVAREDVPGDPRLVAYVVLKLENGNSGSEFALELRNYLKRKLPAYMLPSSFVALAALPLTPNGKIDRRALPAPDRTRLQTSPFTAPSTPIEQTLVTIWTEVLGFEQISTDDHFLELGGHSLLATQVMSRIRDLFQVELPLRCLFDSPTIAELAKKVEAVGSQSSQIQGAIVPASRDQTIPLSFMQEQLWFLDQLVPNHPFYNVPEAIRLEGKLDISILQQGLQEIVRRHEALRTTFVLHNDQPVQVIDSDTEIQLSVIDLQDLPEAERQTQLQNLLTQAAQQPFHLACAPLLQATLFQSSEHHHTLLLNIHHTVCDEWSFGVLWRELSILYLAFLQGQPSPLPEPTLQYADFAIWQRQWLQNTVLESQLAYWKQQLSGALPVLQLPSDRPRPTIPSYQGARHYFVLPPVLTEQFQQLSRREGATLFMTLLAAFQTLLFRYTNQEDMLIGSPVANRHRSEVEGTIGFLVNTLVFRTDLSGSPSFVELLRRVREVALDAYAHQDLPFEQLVQALQPDRTLNQNPLFQVMFNLQNIPVSTSEIPNLNVTRFPVDNKTAKFDLFLELSETATGMAGYFEYSTDLFNAETIARMVEQFQILLTGIAANPQQPITTLPLLTRAEQAQLLVWNQTQTEYPEQCVHQFVEAQAEQTPEAIALIFGEQSLTYRELNQRANQLAHYLQSLGVEADVPVGICVERSLDLLIGVLGILKAGGAYVPLDPAYPQERLSYMMENADSTILVTQKGLLDTIPGDYLTRIYIDTEWTAIAPCSTENPTSNVTLDHLAYVIYTSGSTGKPKGVAMPHRALSNLLTWQMHHSTLAAGARTLQFAPISFDVSFQESFATLGSGGTLILIPDDTRRDAIQLLHILQTMAVERVFLPFVALQHLAEVAESEGIVPTHLREVITAGEQLRITQPIAHWFSQLPHCTLHNHYGPSESHVVTSFTLTGSPATWATLPPIGKPIANTQIHLLDAQLQLVPLGVPGELYIGGVSLARGYLNRSDLTEQRFITHSGLHGEAVRLYKTGDLARYLPDGNIEYLGRIDQQVKIRGYRIELGEVEVVLEQHSATREAVAIVREDHPGEKRLVAYVVPQALDNANQEAALRPFCQAHLPEYMVPSAFVFLDKLPLTPSGKVDRRSLPIPDYSRSRLPQTFVPPTTAIERQLAELWVQVLKIDQISIHDNFFELGGHSLLGTLLVVKIRESFGVELSLRRFLEIPTIAELAQLIEATQNSATATPLTNSAIDLMAEAMLDPSIQANHLSFVPVEEPTAILLTGATGFLGAFLLHALLQQTQAAIYCLVRAADREEGQKRLQRNLERYSIWDEDMRSRIIPVVGDLSKPGFGLSTEQFQQLASAVDVIYHNGGSVNFIYPYAVMKAPNVLGSQEVLRLASQKKIKPVHFVSTAGVFSPVDYADKRTIYEQDEPDRIQGLYGYTQSKWVAEKFMVTARSRGIPTSIYRPFWIEGHSQTGACNDTDFLRSLIKGCIQLGIVPDWKMRVDMLPVDYLSQAIVHIAQQTLSQNQVFHFSNPHSLSWQQLVNWMQTFGYTLESLPYEQWVTTMMAQVADRPENALYPFLPFFSEQLLESQMSVPDLYFKANPLRFDCQNTLKGLANASIDCPPVDDSLLQTYFSSWIDSGFIQPPQKNFVDLRQPIMV